MNIPAISVFGLSIFVSVNCLSQTKLTWSDATSLLYTNSISLKQAELRELIAKNSVEISRGSMYPNLYFNANNQHTLGMIFDQISGKLITGNEWSNYATGTLGTSIVLYQGGQKQNALKTEQIKLELAALDKERLVRELQLQLLEVFTQALINRDLWEAAQSQMKFAEQQLQQEGTLVEIGKRTLIDYSQAKAKYANDKVNAVTSKNAFDISILKLKQLLELELSEEIILVAPEELIIETLVPTYALNNDPYLNILDKQLELGEIQIKSTRSTYFPTITLNGGYGTNFSSQRKNFMTGETISFWSQINQNRTFSGSLVLTVPIFDGFRTKFNVKNARLNQENLLYEKKRIRRERLRTISQSVMEYQGTIEELEAVQANYDANKINYDAINERYKVGKSSSIDLYKALTEFNISEFRLITSKYSMFYKREFLLLIDK